MPRDDCPISGGPARHTAFGKLFPNLASIYRFFTATLSVFAPLFFNICSIQSRFSNQPHGLSNGSDAPPKAPLLFDGPVAGVCVADADVQPLKSSSGVMVGWFLADDMGAPHPPEISFGVMREGGLPISTGGALGFAGVVSGVLHAFSLPEDHGSNMVELF